MSSCLSGDSLQHHDHCDLTGLFQSFKPQHTPKVHCMLMKCVCACLQWNSAPLKTDPTGSVTRSACRLARRRTPTRNSSVRLTPRRAAAAAPSVIRRLGRKPKLALAASRIGWASFQTPFPRSPRGVTPTAISLGSAAVAATRTAPSALSAAHLSASRAPAEQRHKCAFAGAGRMQATGKGAYVMANPCM